MKRTLLAAVLALAVGTAAAAEIAGVRVEDTAKVGGTDLVLNGAGKRTKLMFDVYVAALYLPAKKAAAADVLASPAPSRVSLTLMRDITADQLVEALVDGVKANTTPGELEKIKPQLDSLESTMRAIGGAKKGDVVTMDFLADGGTAVALNGKPQGKPIAGADFQRALLAVWLGGKPVQADLKKAMLGG
jgi:long-chain acyl-CoA synthetase